uniref:Uncharacterized protein n=1 Tax=Vaucheria litorea TaxID=109269 RepID=H6WBC0_VAULI|nr:hypothetical protein [Vaucheria litorea]
MNASLVKRVLAHSRVVPTGANEIIETGLVLAREAKRLAPWGIPALIAGTFEIETLKFSFLKVNHRRMGSLASCH